MMSEVIIQFENENYRKVDREASFGDVVEFIGINSKVLEIGKLYKCVKSPVGLLSTKLLIDNKLELYPLIYHSHMDRNKENVIVYELISY